MPAAALVPIIVLVVGHLAWIVRDILTSEVRYLPRGAWIAVGVLSIPLGGIVYLLVGKEHS